MESLPEPAGPRKALADALAALVATHGVRAVVEALATLCRWRAHHVRSNHGPWQLAHGTSLRAYR